MSLTLTAAREVARAATRHGYFASESYNRSGWVACPKCRERVTASRPTAIGGDTAQARALVKALQEAVVIHLREGDCGAYTG